jgi:phosphatidylserine/phosphatidylglycerophosphate/cardiolipin synthase-like enzyme
VRAIVDELNAATRSIQVQAYVLTSDSIGAALVRAKKRGVNVQVILDHRSGTRAGGEAEFLVKYRITVLLDGFHHQLHDKIMIIDQSVVITGSFNFSDKAENENAENLLIIKDAPDVALRYVTNWKRHAKHSESFVARDEPVVGGDETVYVTKAGERYHREDCQYVRQGARAIMLEQAVRSGKSPCKRCNP